VGLAKAGAVVVSMILSAAVAMAAAGLKEDFVGGGLLAGGCVWNANTQSSATQAEMVVKMRLDIFMVASKGAVDSDDDERISNERNRNEKKRKAFYLEDDDFHRKLRSLVYP
jgi:hypothetical protein